MKPVRKHFFRLASLAILKLGIAFAPLCPSLHSASLLPPVDETLEASNIKLLMESGENRELQDLFASSDNPIFVIPLFTQCRGTCPLITQSLIASVGEIAGAEDRMNVLLFSFDKDDTREDLEAFRKLQNLPEWWVLATSDFQSIRQFLDPLRFRFMKSEDQFAHPNQLFFFSPDWIWRGSIYGDDFTSDQILEAINRSQGSMPFWRRLIVDPQFLAVASALSLSLILLGLFLFVLLRRQARDSREIR